MWLIFLRGPRQNLIFFILSIYSHLGLTQLIIRSGEEVNFAGGFCAPVRSWMKKKIMADSIVLRLIINNLCVWFWAGERHSRALVNTLQHRGRFCPLSWIRLYYSSASKVKYWVALNLFHAYLVLYIIDVKARYDRLCKMLRTFNLRLKTRLICNVQYSYILLYFYLYLFTGY